MPGLFPNLLANGASGIAVGMATSIPPHNAAELIDAATILIDEPEAGDARLMELVQGPDFPTGGVLVDSAEIIALAYATGRGAFRVRARWSIEKGAQGSWTAVVSEIPYQVPKGKLIEQIAALIADKKLPILADVRDESDEKIRIVIEPRSRTVDADVLMESLFRLTDLEVRVSLNLNVLDADADAAGDEPEGGAGAVGRLPARGAGPPRQPPDRQDRRPAGAAPRLYDRLPQSRPGDRDHPHRGRAEAGDDRRVRAHRPPGRGDPQHAAAVACAGWRRCSSRASATSWRRSATACSSWSIPRPASAPA